MTLAADIAREQAQVRVDEAEAKAAESLGIAIADLLAQHSPGEGFDRAAERERLHRAARATGPGASVVWVEGAAGSGKSSLLEQVAGELAAEGAGVLRARCSEVDGAPPGWAWRDLLTGERFVSDVAGVAADVLLARLPVALLVRD